MRHRTIPKTSFTLTSPNITVCSSYYFDYTIGYKKSQYQSFKNLSNFVEKIGFAYGVRKEVIKWHSAKISKQLVWNAD